MKARGLSLKRMGPDAAGLSLATAAGPVFNMLDPPGVEDAHGDTMDSGALRLPPGVNEIPLYWLHSYHDGLLPDLSPENRLPVGTATVWEEGGQWYFTPTFSGLTDLSNEAAAAMASGEVMACSIGYRTVRGTPNGKGPDGKGEDVHEARLMEVSLIPPGERGAKAGAVRVKAMADETQKPEQSTEQDLKTLVAAVLQAVNANTAKVDALAAKVDALTQEEAAEESTEEKSDDAPEEPPAKDVSTKFWGRFRQPAA